MQKKFIIFHLWQWIKYAHKNVEIYLLILLKTKQPMEWLHFVNLHDYIKM